MEDEGILDIAGEAFDWFRSGNSASASGAGSGWGFRHIGMAGALLIGIGFLQWFVGFAAGTGMAWGHAYRAGDSMFSGSRERQWVLGSRMMRLKAGDRVVLHYQLNARAGCLSYSLTRFPRIDTKYYPDANGELADASGDVVLVAHDAGLNEVAVFPSFVCGNTAQRGSRMDLTYTLKWYKATGGP